MEKCTISGRASYLEFIQYTLPNGSTRILCWRVFFYRLDLLLVPFLVCCHTDFIYLFHLFLSFTIIKSVFCILPHGFFNWTLCLIYCLGTKQQPLVLKNEANAEVPETCIPSTGQQGATPLVAKRSQIVCKSRRKGFIFSLDLLPLWSLISSLLQYSMVFI